jgi:hypothetical protein
MSSSSSRREVLKKAATVAATIAAGPLAMAHDLTQTPPAPSDEPIIDELLAETQAQLVQPFDAATAKLARQALRDNRAASRTRLKFHLPENSEPAFEFSATGTGKR